MVMRRLKQLVGGAAFFLLVAAVAAIAVNSASAAKRHAAVKQIVIGFPNDLSSTYALPGNEELNAAKLAVADINARDKSVHVTLVTVDTQSTPATAIAAVQGLLGGKHLNGVVGMTVSNEGLAIKPLVRNKQIPTILLQVTLDSNTPNNVLSMGAPPATFIPLDITVGLKGNKAIKRLAFIYQDNPTLVTELAVLQKTAIAARPKLQVVSIQGGSLLQTDFSSQVSVTIASKPDAVIVLCFPQQGGGIAAQLRQFGFQGPILGQAADGQAIYRKVAGSAAIGHMFASVWDISAANKVSRTVAAKFAAAYPTLPPTDVNAMQAWDAIHIMVAAIKAGKGSYGSTVHNLHTMTFKNTALQDTITFYKPGSEFAGSVKLGGVLVQYQADGSTKVIGHG